jgi:hypothetical protein
LEPSQVKAPGEAILPECDHRVGRRLPRPHRGQDESCAGGGQLVNQGGRGVVEVVSIVDEEDQAASVAPLDQGGGGAAQQI